jgi:hypothetical protein
LFFVIFAPFVVSAASDPRRLYSRTASAMLAADMAMRLRETLEAPSSFASGIR